MPHAIFKPIVKNDLTVVAFAISAPDKLVNHIKFKLQQLHPEAQPSGEWKGNYCSLHQLVKLENPTFFQKHEVQYYTVSLYQFFDWMEEAGWELFRDGSDKSSLYIFRKSGEK